MNAPYFPKVNDTRLVDPTAPNLAARIEHFVMAHPDGTPFHRPAWLEAVAKGTGNPALALIAERRGTIVAYLPLSEVHSPLFGRVLASSGFAVDGGLLSLDHFDAGSMCRLLEEMAARRSCGAIELRGGELPGVRANWAIRYDSHCGFTAPLATDEERQFLAIPRKQRAEVRKGLAHEMSIESGTAPRDRAAHYAVYAESVRNLGTPVFPRALFAEVLDRFGDAADILTVRQGGVAVASVLSLYHGGTVLPYWGGGTRAARALRANDVMYYALMNHARQRGCHTFDFGRSKTDTGAYHFKRNWGFEPQPLAYAQWTAPGTAPRDANPLSPKHAARIALWQRLPLPLANFIGPMIARGLG